MKRATLKDIARMADVSVATVSYVLNNVDNQSIPETTRCKIMRIAKELEYTPNLSARTLVRNKSGLVGILINEEQDIPYWKKQSHFTFVDGLQKLLTTAGYHTLFITIDANDPSLNVIIERNLEAVFLVDVKDEMFYTISSKFVEGIPLIVIDSIIEDNLFQQITYNFHSALKIASKLMNQSFCLIMENFNNQALVNYILTNTNVAKDHIYIVDTPNDLDEIFKQTQFKEAIVINEFIGSYVERSGYFNNLAVICTCSCPEILSDKTEKIMFKEDKSKTAFHIMNSLLRRNEYHSNNSNINFIEVKI
ncbi:LacI family DNA-binding transcriptional regulator [Paenibacillus agri]|uniref:LacI family DNA-binding transcriptional regulator n=1 Tax=Paenibacillus agri TaxID=2744309 RepID=A0A850EFK0_9BACL|nr:LacI family DNA-binding transcriptional regulator [Paenibacillus agri]NUU59925.1 LacI family DNA-binding transcriptional regulator [Paenibacillus agri]